VPAWFKGPSNGPVIGTSVGSEQKSRSLKIANMKGLLAGKIRMRMSTIVTRIREMNR
jgi:hypothetical protein